MYKKYRIRKGKKNDLFFICCIIMISSIFMSAGYAFFSETLTIKGIANIKKTEVETGNSVYTWKISNSWGKGTEGEPMNYQIDIDITNYDGDLSSWTISFDVPYQVKEGTVRSWSGNAQQVDNTITITPYTHLLNFQNGTTKSISVQLGVISTEQLEIENFKFAGKLISLKK